jgi:hypothetical protein
MTAYPSTIFGKSSFRIADYLPGPGKAGRSATQQPETITHTPQTIALLGGLKKRKIPTECFGRMHD